MIKLNGNVLTEKGQVKANARKTLVDYVAKHPEVFCESERNDNGTYSIEVNDSEQNVIYVNFEITVSTMNAGDRAKRKSKSKKVETEDIEVIY